MQQKINWNLKNKKETLISKKQILCEYKENEFIIIKDEFGTQNIDLRKNQYFKVNDEYTMKIDFLEKICDIILPTTEKCSMNIECAITHNKKQITLEYEIEDKLILTIELT